MNFGEQAGRYKIFACNAEFPTWFHPKQVPLGLAQKYLEA
jgi:hypothetical protein